MESYQIQQIKNIFHKYHQSYYQEKNLVVTFDNLENVNLKEFQNYRKNGELMLYNHLHIMFDNQKYFPGSYLIKHNNKFRYYFPKKNTYSIDGIINIIKKKPLNEESIEFMTFMIFHTGLVNNLNILNKIYSEFKLLNNSQKKFKKKINFLIFNSI